MIELILQLLPVIKELLPVIIELFDKGAEGRQEAVKMGVAMQRAAEAGGDWRGMMMGGLFQRIGKMDEAQSKRVIEAIQGAQAAIEEASK